MRKLKKQLKDPEVIFNIIIFSGLTVLTIVLINIFRILCAYQ